MSARQCRSFRFLVFWGIDGTCALRLTAPSDVCCSRWGRKAIHHEAVGATSVRRLNHFAVRGDEITPQ